MSAWTDEEVKAYELKKLRDTSLAEVPGLAVRVVNALEKNAVFTVGELADLGKEELMSMRTFGAATVIEVAAALKAVGVETSWDVRAGEKAKKGPRPGGDPLRMF